MPVKVIAGLGNPGQEYEQTRHNVGFDLLDYIAKEAKAEWRKERRLKSLVCDAVIGGQSCMLVKPQTYMNCSGLALRAVANKFRILPSEFLVAYDEYQIAVGDLKLSMKGGDGGHNGVASLLSELGEDWLRLRIGIAPLVPRTVDMKEFVLGKFTSDEAVIYQPALNEFAKAVELVVRLGPEMAMNDLNKRKKKSNPNEPDARAQAQI